MPLETGSFIPELDDNNPLGADNVSAGDDHIRLLKRCTTGSFGAFVGNTGTPKSVTLTEDQINQLPVDIVSNTGNISTNSGDIATINADAAFTAINETITGLWTFSDQASVIGGVVASNLLDKSAAETITGQWRHDDDVTFANGVTMFAEELGGTPQQVFRMLSSDILSFGSNLVADVRMTAMTQLNWRIGSTTEVSIIAAADGALQVKDRSAVTKLAGFRNPTAITAGGNRDLAQSDEGRILLASNASATYTAVTLEAFTTIRLIVSATGVSVVPDAGVTMNFLDGLGSAQPAVSGVDIARNSVLELVYQSATSVQVFGNGITVI